MKIVMIASESRPFCKTGGLADVVYSLSKELVQMGEDVSIIIPYYDLIKSKKVEAKKIASFDIMMSWRKQGVNVFETESDGIKYYLLENQQYFERGHLYGDGDDGERFALLALASKQLMIELKMKPDIVNVHDWQSAMVPVLIKEDPIHQPKFFKKTHYVLTIHNPAFQGMLDGDAVGNLFNLPYSLYENGNLRFKDRFSTLKSGIMYADKVVTVSPNHHNELLTPYGGMGLDAILRLREWDFTGVLNGIDYLEFNPGNDRFIPNNYEVNTVVSGKKANKKALLERFNMKDPKRPLISLVTRITWQKGFDIILPAVDEIIAHGANIIMLGSGEYNYEQKWEELLRKYPGRIGLYIGYSDPLAHLVYAGSDFFLMPSLFEPCGLGQMIAQRYGTPPIVRLTGGLSDSVICYDGNNAKVANGFGFSEYSAFELLKVTLWALDAYKKEKVRVALMKNAMNTNNTWRKSAELYMGIYRELVGK